MTNPWSKPAIERYHDDPEFHALVDSLEYFVADGKFTIYELKQALTIAVIKFESRRLPRLRLSAADSARILSGGMIPFGTTYQD